MQRIGVGGDSPRAPGEMQGAGGGVAVGDGVRSEVAVTATAAEKHLLGRENRPERESGKQESKKTGALPAPFLFSCFPD